MPKLDDRAYKLLESKIDLLRRKDKDTQARKVLDEVFDYSTLIVIYKFISNGVIDTVDYPVSTGKEGNVFKATAPDGTHLAVKIYRVSNATFKTIAKYITGDRRFEGLSTNRRKLIFAWAQKEMKNLSVMEAAEVRVPHPFGCEKNVLVMEYIGDETGPAPQLKDVKVDDPGKLADTVIGYMRNLYKIAKLVHADLSEYNILIKDQTPVVIDVGQSVTLDHPMAEEFLKRDATNLARYLTKLGMKYSAEDILKIVKSD